MADLLQGRFVWYELMTPDPKSAEGFYSKVVGWKTRPFAAGETYTLWMAGEQSVGGLMPMPPDAKAAGVPPNWLIYVAVHDADATVKQAQSLGAKVEVAVREIPQVGRFAVLADPQGAHISILQPDGPSPTAPDAAPGLLEFSWRELATTDVAAALSFYTRLFGWEKLEANDMGPMGVYQVFGRFGHSLGGIYRKPADRPGPPHWLPYVRVPGIQTAVGAVRAQGGSVLNGPVEVPGGDLVAQILDPQGAAFAVHQTKG